MKLNQVVIVLLMLCQLQIAGQTRLKGVLSDAQTNSPVEYAAIYINGTIISTISDSTGNFKLENIKFPCQLVVSHVSYITKLIPLNSSIQQSINLSLTPKEIVVEEVNVFDKNLKENNISTFKEYFLGTDVWGRNAEIENEDAIIFSRDYETNYWNPENKLHPYPTDNQPTVFQWNEDSTLASYNVAINLKAYSREPLIINLPLLGYDLYVNLINFVMRYNQPLSSYESTTLGTYYFHPITPESKRDSIRINKNRLKAYYNSSYHFCRSLYEKKLKENGYRVFEDVTNKTDSKIKLIEFNLDSCLKIEGEIAEITGLKDRQFLICYYQHSNGTPIDLTQKKAANPVKSGLYFLDDNCLIRKDGTTPGNSLVFGSFIGTKKIGASLPDDYEPAK